jgi:hypothetical protein
MPGELSCRRPATVLPMPSGVLRRCRRSGPGWPTVAATAARDAGKTRGGAMGYRQGLMTPAQQLRAQRAQQMSRIYTVMVCLGSLIFVQFLYSPWRWRAISVGASKWHCPRRWCQASAVLPHTGYSGIFSYRVGTKWFAPFPSPLP